MFRKLKGALDIDIGGNLKIVLIVIAILLFILAVVRIIAG